MTSTTRRHSRVAAGRSRRMTTERAIRLLAGGVVLLSLALGLPESPAFVSKYFLWLTAFAGLNLFQSGFTGFCPPEKLFRRVGLRSESGTSRA